VQCVYVQLEKSLREMETVRSENAQLKLFIAQVGCLQPSPWRAAYRRSQKGCRCTSLEICTVWGLNIWLFHPLCM